MLENLKKEMEKREIKNKDIAELLGIKSPAVSKRLYGSVKLHDDEKKKIANLLNIKDYEYLFEDTGYTPPKKENEETVFSKRFSELLERDERTQKQIAEALGVNERTIIDWKQGKQATNIEMLKKISVILNASFAYLSGESDYCYPSSVNYLDDSMNEYQKQIENLAIAVKIYLKYSGYNVEVFDKIVSEDPIRDGWAHFDRFYREHLEEYAKLDQLESEFDKYAINFYKKFGITKVYDEDKKPTAKEIEVSKKLSKDKYFRSLCNQIDELNATINDKSREYRKKKEFQAKRVKEFFDNLPELILKELNAKLSEIIDEYQIFDFKNNKIKDCTLRLSSLEKRLFEYETLRNDLVHMNDLEFANSICWYLPRNGETEKDGFFKHKFSSSLYDYEGSISDKNSIIEYLNDEINKSSNLIKQWKEHIKEIEKENQ